jgi:peptide/nickel transport system permease protein
MTEIDPRHRDDVLDTELDLSDLPPDEELEAPEGEVGAALSVAGQGLTDKPLSPGRLAWRRFRRHKPALISTVILLILAIFIFFPHLLTTADPIRPSDTTFAEPPSAAHWAGTNGLGVDQLSRILHGGQISFKVGIAVALFSSLLGIVIGAAAGYFGGWLDNLLMRVTDLFLAIPILVVLIVMSRLPAQQAWARTAFGDTGSVRAVITILALFFWMPMARIVRGQILSLKEKEFVEAARAVGASDTRILLRHLIPNCMGPIIVALTLSVAAAILTEAALSFLGFGITSTNVPTWGYMISFEKSSYDTQPWLVIFPGMMILTVVLCVNYLGDGLRDALDPKQRKIG